MSIKASWRERLRYRVDNFLAKGSGSLFLALFVSFLIAFAIIIGVRAVLNYLSPDPDTPFFQQIWLTYLQLTDPGNMNQDNTTPAAFKIGAVIAGMTGVIIFSSLIAFLNTALNQAISRLKQGHTRVLETGHTLILGWGPRVGEILRELAEANESESDPVVTILAEEEKDKMDAELATTFRDRKNTRLVTRNGSTASLTALELVNAPDAKSAIVLATCGAAATPAEKFASDARVIKTVLALDTKVGQRDDFKIVAEIFSSRNRQVVQDISPERVVVVDAEEILAKIMVQTSRTSGLSVVYAELLSFEGCEFYFYKAEWNNITFGAMQYHFPDGVPIGIRKADGKIMVRPEPTAILADDDEIVIVAQDDSTIDYQQQPVVKPQDRPLPSKKFEQRQERMLVLGWSQKAPIIISEYSDYVLEGSKVDVVISDPSEQMRAKVEAVAAESDTIQVNLIDKNPLDGDELLSLEPFGYDNIIILPQRPDDEMNAERTDSETIVVLLHLRRISKELAEKGITVKTKILTEVLDSQNQDLISRAGVNDFLISDRIVSMIFAQLSVDPRILDVYNDLFEEAGSEIYVKPASLYFDSLPQRCTFADLMALAQKRNGEVCIGYKLKSLEQDPSSNFGVTLIPPKDTEVNLSAEDALVVVAEDER
ncbi:MAG: hypothetical protein R3B84_15280 [Zavarzinella sp.]